ncbi:GIY-YIG nuclease family protein [Labedella gwakjiensis]|nr:GIY-YIG nuclease family protein [Labedella gwakjiensis]
MIEHVFEPLATCVAPSGSGVSCGLPSIGAPVPLCAGHVDAVSEWIETETGRTDLLPAPCRVCGSRLGARYPSGWVCAVCEWRVGEVLDGELPPPRIDVVYYIRFDGRIKIGTTANPRQRLQRLWHDDVLAFERGDRLVERRRHEQFAALRQGRSEWFSPAPPLDRHIAGIAAGVDDPWARYTRWVSEALALRG